VILKKVIEMKRVLTWYSNEKFGHDPYSNCRPMRSQLDLGLDLGHGEAVVRVVDKSEISEGGFRNVWDGVEG
jgi:hypothetical protein